MAAPERDSSALLIERLLGDAGFRERFQRDPVAAFREAGIDGPHEELASTAGRAMETLEIRESRSSLAGVMIAAAIEALAVSGLAEHAAAATPADAHVHAARASSVDQAPTDPPSQAEEAAPSGGGDSSDQSNDGGDDLSDSGGGGSDGGGDGSDDGGGDNGGDENDNVGTAGDWCTA